MEKRLALVLAALLTVVLAPILFTSQTIGNFGDLFLHHLPTRIFAQREIMRGDFPFWNPHIFCGTPFFANPQSGVLYPLSLGFYLFPVPRVFGLYVGFHLLMAGIFFALMLREAGLSYSACWMGGLLYPLLPVHLLKLPHGALTVLSSLIYLPLVLLGAVAFWRRPAMGRALLLGLFLWIQLLSGHPQPLFATTVLVAAFFLTRLEKKDLKPLALGLALATPVAIPNLWGMFQFVNRSIRGDWDAPFILVNSLHPKFLAYWISLRIFGDPIRGDWISPETPSVFFETAVLHVGWVALFLGLWELGRRFHERRWFLPLTFGAGIFIALGQWNPLFRPFLIAAPGFQWFRAPARWCWLVIWALAVAAAFGWQRIKRPAWRAMLLLLGVGQLAFTTHRLIYPENLRPYLDPGKSFAILWPWRYDYRVLSDASIANPNKSVILGARNASGYEALIQSNLPRFLTHHTGQPSASTVSLTVEAKDLPVFRQLGVRHLLRPEPTVRLEEIPDPLPSTVHLTGQAIKPVAIQSFRSAKRVFEPLAGGSLVFAESYYPGWKAYVAGRRVPIQPVEGFLQEISLPDNAASHNLKVIFQFQPRAWAPTLLLCLLSLTGLAAWGLRRLQNTALGGAHF